MARLSGLPNDRLLRDMPERDKLREAIQFLKDNPDETPVTAARACNVKNHDTVRKAWQRERKKMRMPKLYAVSHAINGGNGATKQMMFNCAIWMRKEDGKTAPSWRWFIEWLKSILEFYTIKTKPIASHRVNLHTEQALHIWFETEYLPALEDCDIYRGDRIYNMDEKGARICILLVRKLWF
ncbi:hypothetical protein NA56DRAFT_751299 [Hyaloscypha hepaticicola]|uniref:Uncharacterized protein n=1 Tax=Hyaloscypha hepaticicola TaxID=2082293 RepID=A0A2J6PX60_9HELO|nr:hypothetical protein NA56DRAFT_751299 [Hyaloscypha hepaticicola]